MILLAAAIAASAVATVIVPTGLDPEDAEHLHARVHAQVSAAGGTPLALPAALEGTAECLDAPDCARALLPPGARWLLWVEAVRAGPKVQIEARLVDDAGRGVRQAVIVTGVEAALVSPVPAEVLAPLRAPPPSAEPEAPVEPAEERGDVPLPVEPLAHPGTAEKSPAQAPPSSSSLLDDVPPLALAGAGVATAGVLVTLVSLALIPAQLAVINDRLSLGAEKEAAASMVPALALLATGGALAGAAGGAMWFLGGQDAAGKLLGAPED